MPPSTSTSTGGEEQPLEFQPPPGGETKPTTGTAEPYSDEELIKLLGGDESMNTSTQDELLGADIEKDKEKIDNSNVSYFNGLSFENKVKITQDEGYYMPGVDIMKTINIMLDSLSLGPDYMKDQFKDKKMSDVIGETVNFDPDTGLDLIGYRSEKFPHRKLKPEDVLSDNSTMNNIIREGKKFSEDDDIHLNDLLTMVRMLSKYKYDDEQWVRVASLLETIYQYYGGSDLKRDDFFNSNKKIDYKEIKNIEEFWKTDFIFMTDNQRKQFIDELQFYSELPLKVEIVEQKSEFND
jgi:hypothetical protein